MSEPQIKHIVEAILMAAGKPLNLDQILAVFGDGEKPERDALRAALAELQQDYAERGLELIEVASGYRIQVKQDMEPWVSRLTEDKPARYSRALLETLALVAYRQPVTRGEIEDVRGVAVSTNIIKTLQEQDVLRRSDSGYIEFDDDIKSIGSDARLVLGEEIRHSILSLTMTGSAGDT